MMGMSVSVNIAHARLIRMVRSQQCGGKPVEPLKARAKCDFDKPLMVARVESCCLSDRLASMNSVTFSSFQCARRRQRALRIAASCRRCMLQERSEGQELSSFFAADIQIGSMVTPIANETSEVLI